MIDKKISNEFQINGVVLLKNIIDQKWIEELRKGIEYNFQNPSEYKCVYEEINDKEIDAKLASLKEIYEKSDIISIHLPLTDETKNMVNEFSFSQMKNKPIIINTSRGGIINESDLIEAYHKNIISGFALDVFENEPIESKFYHKIKPGMNCILTPHISGVTTESNIRVSDFIVKKITDFFN